MKIAEYIDREAIVAKSFSAGICDAYGNYYGSDDIVLLSDILAASVADVEPVRHGQWEFHEDVAKWGYPYLCSQCGKAHNHKEPYCPNCGAKMDMRGVDHA